MKLTLYNHLQFGVVTKGFDGMSSEPDLSDLNMYKHSSLHNSKGTHCYKDVSKYTCTEKNGT